MERYALLCKGDVQGVGFRYFVHRVAQRMNLTGFVINLDDGDVAIEVQGPVDQLADFTRTIKAGNGYSRLTRLEIKLIPNVDLENSFAIRF
jgi:acylphosphatase